MGMHTLRSAQRQLHSDDRRLAGESSGDRIIAMIRNYYAEAKRLFHLLIAE